MKKILGLCVLLALAFPALGCDEECQRERASAANNVEFPGYLTWKFCEDTKLSFMEGDIASLENYRSERLNVEHKRRMTNIRDFVVQRKEWLQECDRYLELTQHGRIFTDQATTDEVFAAMDAVTKELNAALKGVTYVSEDSGRGEDVIIGSRFDNLFKLIDTHRTKMMLDSQFVTN